MSWHRHRWTKWRDFNQPYTMQERYCVVCNKRRSRLS